MMDYRMENKGMRFLSLFPLSDKLFFLSFNPMVLSRLPALVLEDNKHKEEEGKRAGEKERCSGSYCQAVVFLVIKHDSISERPGYWQWGSRYTAHAGRNLPVKEFCYLRTNDTTAAMWSQILWASLFFIVVADQKMIILKIETYSRKRRR